MKQISKIMENPTVYRLWQSPFVEAKFAPIRKHNDLDKVRRVLDVGCGPGTNSNLFSNQVKYLGVDINPDYIEQARRLSDKHFEVADVCRYQANADETYDFILLNSLLHHIPDDDVLHILHQVSKQLGSDGNIHILELVLPDEAGIPRLLARADRGEYPRRERHWKKLCGQVLDVDIVEPYDLTGCGLNLWKMVYIRARGKNR